MTNRRIIGIILAGGQSRRYGRPKMFELFAGKPFYEWAYVALKDEVDETTIVTQQSYVSRFPASYTVVTDEPTVAQMGPLAGIYSVMASKTADLYVVLPCDMPLIDQYIVRRLLALHERDVSVVTIHRKVQPLVSVWERQVKDTLYTMLSNGDKRVKDLLHRVNVHYIPVESLTTDVVCFTNVNTQQEYEELKKWLT